MNTKTFTMTLAIGLFSVSAFTVAAQEKRIQNRLINYPGFLSDAAKVGPIRESRRITEQQFIRMAVDRATIIFDARSEEKYRLLHVKGAKHLSLPDITEAELQKVIPNKGTRVLIYCNNNFENSPSAFPAKVATASLNIYTFNTLYGYGYTNVYELGPLLDINKTRLPLEGTKARSAEINVQKLGSPVAGILSSSRFTPAPPTEPKPQWCSAPPPPTEPKPEEED